MLTSDFDFELPPELIAQHPAVTRDQSRLLVWNRHQARLHHHQFPDLLQFLQPGDLLVLNDSKVLQARLRAVNEHTTARFEILLLLENSKNDWWAMLRPAKRARLQSQLTLLDTNKAPAGLRATVVDQNSQGHRRLLFHGTPNILQELPRLGEIPLPPYIKRHRPDPKDQTRYQTVYARHEGSIAAPTAGLHFTSDLLDEIKKKSIAIAPVTLHVGLGTFAPIKAERLTDHVMHQERYSISDETAQAVNQAKQDQRRVIAIGTTSLRVLESAAAERRIRAGASATRLFVYPPYRFQIVDALLTNFHLPQSTLLMLVSAFLTPGQTNGPDLLRRAYAEAIHNRYRFFSYGDAMFIE